ncbi:hypothetical protein BD830_105244 [Maritimibacter alkaliphilus HTCC2654]|nr:hypothetical protein [Maritimibacter alkaliphilus]TYP81577.1 hypothetical protein BD830_105244 [Maritimibacter alkaliphilus HTCC2654]
MPNRLRTAMAKEGIVLVGSFVQLTAGDILRKQGLGKKSYREARATLEALGLSLGMELCGWDEELAFEARKALGRNVQKRVFELIPTEWHAHDTLESELFALLLEVEDERNAEMLSVFYGFNEDGPKTLEYSGQPYGLTRERVRQIAARTEKKLRELWRPLCCLDKAAKIITSELGPLFTNKDFFVAARNAGISEIDFHVEGVLAALDVLGEKNSITKIRIGQVELYGTADEVSFPKRLLSALRKETSANGCTNIQRLALIVGLELDDADRVRDLLEMFPEVEWLDAGSTWLLSQRSTRNRLANIAEKVFSVAPSVEINELRAALRRHIRVNFVPPPDALGRLLEFYGIAKMDNRVAVAGENIGQPDLGINDQGLVYAFEALGSPATREQLEDFCIDGLGMNIHSFYVYLSYSPLVTKLATGVFALVGQDVEPGAISQLKDDIKESRFEDTTGWSKAGTLWWHFQADRPTAKAGTRTVPTFVLNLTSGEWNVKTVDGLKLGAAKIENGFMSGFREAFAALGVDKKDFLQFDFDISNGDVYIRLVGDEPEEFTFSVKEDEFDEESDIETEDN